MEKVTTQSKNQTISAEYPLDAALRTKTSRNDARDIIAIRERSKESRIPASEVFKKAGL